MPAATRMFWLKEKSSPAGEDKGGCAARVPRRYHTTRAGSSTIGEPGATQRAWPSYTNAGGAATIWWGRPRRRPTGCRRRPRPSCDDVISEIGPSQEPSMSAVCHLRPGREDYRFPYSSAGPGSPPGAGAPRRLACYGMRPDNPAVPGETILQTVISRSRWTVLPCSSSSRRVASSASFRAWATPILRVRTCLG